jgi:hypothetical protein
VREDSSDFELPKSFLDAFAGSAHALMTIRANDHMKEPQSVAQAMRTKKWAE